jgi:hypothetical protein
VTVIKRDQGVIISSPDLGEDVPFSEDAAKPNGQHHHHHHLPHWKKADGLHVSLSAIKHETAKGVLKHPFFFQVPPLDTFGWDQEYTWNDYVTVHAGTYSRPGGRGLRSVQFDTMFLDYDAPWTLLGAAHRPSPLAAGHELRQIMNSGTPFRLVVKQAGLWGHMEDLAMDATLRSVHFEQRAGEVDARYTTLQFTEWRDLNITRKRKGHRNGGHTKLPTRYTIQRSSNKTLRDLSKHYYGETKHWRAIVHANRILRKHNWSPSKPLGEIRKNHPHIKTLLIPHLHKHHGGGGSNQ